MLLAQCHSPRNVANKRGRKVAEIYGNDPKATKDDDCFKKN